MPRPLLGLLLLVASIASAAAQTSLNVSTDLVTLGIAASNMVPNQPTLDSGPLFEAAIKYANTHKIPQVIANQGAYYFLSVSATLSGGDLAIFAITTPMTIDLQGSDLYFAHAEKTAILLTSLTNVTVQNFTIDFLQQLYTQVQVTSVNSTTRQLQVTARPGWQTPTALAAALNSTLVTSGYPPTFLYVFRNGQTWVGSTRFVVDQPLTDTTLTLDASNATSTIAGIQPGDIAVLNLRAGGAGMLTNSITGCTVRNIKIYSGFGGLRTVSTTGTLFEHIEVMPRPGTDRLISTVADGISPSQGGLNQTVRLCRSIRTCDDGMSPNSFVFGSVQSVLSSTSIQVAGPADTALNGGYSLPVGATVVFEQATDGTILGSATVVSEAQSAVIGGIPQLILNFSSAVPVNATGSYVYGTDPSQREGNLVLERNTVQQQTWGRGFSLWGLENATVYGNYLNHTIWAGIAIMHQLPPGTDWIVPPVVNLTVSNNVIDGANLGPDIHTLIEVAGIQALGTSSTGAPMTTSPNQNIYVTGNFIANPGPSALWIGNSTGGVADANYLLDPNNSPNLSYDYPAFRANEVLPLVVETSQNISLGTNTIDSVSGRAFVTDTSYNQLAAYAPGANFRLSAYSLGGLASPAVTLTDADGTLWPLTVVATATNALDVQLPSGAALGGASVSIKSGSTTYFGTLFVDSQDNLAAINQPTYQIAPITATVPAAGGSVSFLVVTQAGAAFTVTDSDSFVTAGSGGTGTSVVTVTLASNSGADRTTTVQIAQQPFTITQAGAADPIVKTQPQTQVVGSGSALTLSVSASGAQSYQWYFNGTAISGATNATLTVPAATNANAGTYTVVAASGSASATSTGALVTISNTPAVAHLADLSILTSITTASPFFTIGTFIGGTGTVGTKPLLLRASGPSLAPFGLPGPTLTATTMSVYSGQTVIASNSGWGGTAELSAAFTAVGAFPFISTSSLDSAVFNPGIATGGYSVQVSGVGTAAGNVLAELYDSTPLAAFTALTPRLINVSVLKTMVAGEVFTAGFIVGGSASEKVLIRADGPALAAAPFNLAGTMADPQISVFNSSGATIASNNDWGTPVGAGAATAAQLNTAFSQVGAFALAAGSKDAAVLVTLSPGGYSAQVTGVSNSAGEVIVEVYEVPSS